MELSVVLMDIVKIQMDPSIAIVIKVLRFHQEDKDVWVSLSWKLPVKLYKFSWISAGPQLESTNEICKPMPAAQVPGSRQDD